jgi:hypothetical protein
MKRRPEEDQSLPELVVEKPDSIQDRRLLTLILEILGDQDTAQTRLDDTLGITLPKAIETGRRLIKKLERRLADTIKEQYNTRLEDHKAEEGLYKVAGQSNTATFGSIYSMVDVTDKADDNRQEAEALRIQGLRTIIAMESEQTMPWGLDLKQLPGNNLDAFVTLGGSAADQRVRLSAGDRDYGSYVTVEAKSLQAASDLIAGCTRSTIHSVDISNPNYQFSEMKFGIDPERPDRMLKWDAMRILQDRAPYGEADRLKTISLAEAARNPGKIKLDYYSVDKGMRLTEVTMVVLPKYDIDSNPDAVVDLHTNSLSPFGEVFFDDPEEIGVFAGLHDPLLMAKWRKIQVDQARKYLDGKAEQFDPVKAIKRIYTILKLDGEIDKAHQVASYLALPEAQLYRMAVELETLAKYLSQPERKWKPAYVGGAVQAMLEVVDPTIALHNSSYEYNTEWRDRMLELTSPIRTMVVSSLHNIRDLLLEGSVGSGSEAKLEDAKSQLLEVATIAKHHIADMAGGFVNESKEIQSIVSTQTNK